MEPSPGSARPRRAAGKTREVDESEGSPDEEIACLLMTLCLALPACALAEAETTATLHVVAYSEEVGQYPLAYTGELTAEALLKGLSAVTKHDLPATALWSRETASPSSGRTGPRFAPRKRAHARGEPRPYLYDLIRPCSSCSTAPIGRCGRTSALRRSFRDAFGRGAAP